jgi:hypothetical protein
MPNVFYFIYIVPLTLSALFSLKSFRLNWPRPYRYFCIFLFWTLFVEIFAICWKLFLFKTTWWNYSNSNIWVYNIYIVPEYLFYIFFFYSYLKKSIAKRIVILSSVGYALFAFANIFWIQKMYTLNSYTIIIGNLLVVFLALNYFNQSLSNKRLTKETSQPLFWISVASLIFFSGSLPYFIFMDYLVKNNIAMAVALFYILLILNTFMYSLYLIAFLCNLHSQK